MNSTEKNANINVSNFIAYSETIISNEYKSWLMTAQAGNSTNKGEKDGKDKKKDKKSKTKKAGDKKSNDSKSSSNWYINKFDWINKWRYFNP